MKNIATDRGFAEGYRRTAQIRSPLFHLDPSFHHTFPFSFRFLLRPRKRHRFPNLLPVRSATFDAIIRRQETFVEFQCVNDQSKFFFLKIDNSFFRHGKIVIF